MFEPQRNAAVNSNKTVNFAVIYFLYVLNINKMCLGIPNIYTCI